MKSVALKRDGQVLIPTLWVANDFLSRFLGLMGRKGIEKDEAVLFPRCNSIHMFFMRFAIDVVMVSKEGKVEEILPRTEAVANAFASSQGEARNRDARW